MKKGTKHSKEAIEKMRIIKLGKKHTEESKKKMGLSHLGNKSRLGQKLSEETKKKVSLAMKGRKITWAQKIGIANKGQVRSIEQRLKMRGKNNGSWKGGITPINKLLRRSKDFKNWQEAVFKRDNWTCQECNERGGKLHPDHIKPFAYYPELRFELTNGRTLCKECHMKTDTWGGGAKKYNKQSCQIFL